MLCVSSFSYFYFSIMIIIISFSFSTLLVLSRTLIFCYVNLLLYFSFFALRAFPAVTRLPIYGRSQVCKARRVILDCQVAWRPNLVLWQIWWKQKLFEDFSKVWHYFFDLNPNPEMVSRVSSCVCVHDPQIIQKHQEEVCSASRNRPKHDNMTISRDRVLKDLNRC